MLAKLKSVASALWSFLGDPKTKNSLLVLLMLGLVFDIVDHETFHTLRETVLSMAF